MGLTEYQVACRQTARSKLR